MDMGRLNVPLVLASASPRRRALLEQVGLEFLVEPSRVDEGTLKASDGAAFARLAAEAKAADVAHRIEGRGVALGADTVVSVDGKVLGKPEGVDEAGSMLASLSGKTHEVITGVALANRAQGLLGSIATQTEVSFRTLTSEEIQRYADSLEGQGKAGAYAIQGVAGGFVESIAGSYSNVVGLPLAQTLQLMREHDLLLEWP